MRQVSPRYERKLWCCKQEVQWIHLCQSMQTFLTVLCERYVMCNYKTNILLSYLQVNSKLCACFQLLDHVSELLLCGHYSQGCFTQTLGVNWFYWSELWRSWTPMLELIFIRVTVAALKWKLKNLSSEVWNLIDNFCISEIHIQQ